MKKIILTILALFLIAGGYVLWVLFAPSVHQPEGRYFYVPTGASYQQVRDSLLEKGIIKSRFWFNKVAQKLGYPSSVKAGKYLVPEKSGLVSFVRMLRNGKQSPVNLVISRKIRMKEDFARLTANKFEFDSAAMYGYLSDDAELAKLGLDSTSYLTAILPDTYTFFWNTTPEKVFSRLHEEAQKFWSAERKARADSMGLNPGEVYTLASIIDEETNYPPDKPLIASVYLNRLRLGWPLGADPTAKFALRNFGLKRIYFSHLRVNSPYNTYINKGLPPGPICSAQKATIDSVLHAPKTDYVFFVANSDFSGKHVFTTNSRDHEYYRRAFIKAQDSIATLKKNKAAQNEAEADGKN